jgi:hypothetical protein
MLNNKIFKILSLSLSLSIASMGFAFAEANLDEMVSIQITAVDEALYERQAEIDRILFETNAKELENKGIFATHTGVVEDYIEVGVTPYTPENADAVSKLLGDGVKVVEGTMAVTLQYNPELNEENPDPRVIMAPELADDSQIVTQVEEDIATEDIKTTADVEAEELADDAQIVSAPAKEKGITPIIIGAAVAVIGIGAVAFMKKKA